MKKTVLISALGTTQYTLCQYKMPKMRMEAKANSLFDKVSVEKTRSELDKLFSRIPLGEILLSKGTCIDKLVLIAPNQIEFIISNEVKGLVIDELTQKGIEYRDNEKAENRVELALDTKDVFSKYFKIVNFKIIKHIDVEREHYQFYKQLTKEIKAEYKGDTEIKLMIDISTGQRDIQNNIYNLISAFESIDHFEIKNVYYGFFDNTKRQEKNYQHEIFDYQQRLVENKKIEKLKEFKDNYTVDSEFKLLIKEDKENSNYLHLIEKFYNALHENNLRHVKAAIKSLQNEEIKESESLIFNILREVQQSFKVRYQNIEEQFLNEIQKDLLEKEYYQQLITMLEGEFRKQVIDSYAIDSKQLDSRGLYSVSEYLLKNAYNGQVKVIRGIQLKQEIIEKYKEKSVFEKENSIKDWNKFLNFRNPLNHGTQKGLNVQMEQEFENQSKKIVELIEQAKNKGL